MSTPRHAGRFRPGYDPRRHCFTREECQRGFRAAEESLSRRYPGCDTHFLMCAIIGSRPWFLLPNLTALIAEVNAGANYTDAEIAARFASE